MREKLIFLVLLILVGIFVQAVPRILNYQGKLVDSSGVGISGTHTLTFRLYTTESGGSPLWTETETLTITNGLFSTLLGNRTPFPDSVNFSVPYWLEVEIDGETMSPREQLASSPYAIYSAQAGSAPIVYSSAADTTRRRGRGVIFNAGPGATLEDTGGEIHITLDVSGAGGGGPIPTIYDVLVAGSDAGGRGIANLANPTAPQDAATKSYVDDYSVSSILGGAGLSPDTPSMGDITLNVKYDNVTIGINPSDQLYVKTGGIGTNEIADGSIRSEDIAPGGITTSNIAERAITTDRIATGAVTSNEIADSAVTMAHLANFSFPSASAGDILYYDGSRWVNLPAGTSGQYLRTYGTGNPPGWETPAARAIFNFLLSCNPSSDGVEAGDTLYSTVKVTGVAGPIQAVSFYTTDLPTGVSASFSPSSCTPPSPTGTCTSTMEIVTSETSPRGTYPLTITGITPGGSQSTTTFSLTIATVPGAVSDLSLTVSAPNIILNWTAPSENGGSLITNYIIYRGTSPNPTTPIDTVGSVLTYADPGPFSPGNTYYYRITAVNAIGEGPYSNEVQWTYYYASCKAILDAGRSTGDGVYTIDPDGVGGNVPFQAYCDMTTDGGGWTIVAAYTGGDGEEPLVSDNERNGNPLSFQHYNINRAKKMALSAISTESIFKRNNGTWIKVNHALFDNNLNTPNTCTHYSVTITANNGATASGYMGYSNYQYSGGGDYGITNTAGFDHHSTSYRHLNVDCQNMYLYSYSSTSADYDAGYDVNIGLGSWSATQSCDSNEGGALVFIAGMR